MNNIEHIGIAVKNLKDSNALFSKLFGKPHYKEEAVESEGVNTSFFKVLILKYSLRYIFSTFALRQNLSIQILSVALPFPSIEIIMLLSFNVWV